MSKREALTLLLGQSASSVIEACARKLADLEPGEAWPTNEELGGNPTGTRDDEYRAGMEEQAIDLLVSVAPLILYAWDQK